MNSTDFVRMTSRITLSGAAYIAVVSTAPVNYDTDLGEANSLIFAYF